jgi:hypothetical protein
MTRGSLHASRGPQQTHGRIERARGTEVRRVPMALSMAAIALVAGVGFGPALSVEVRPATDRPAVQQKGSTASAAPRQAGSTHLQADLGLDACQSRGAQRRAPRLALGTGPPSRGCRHE